MTKMISNSYAPLRDEAGYGKKLLDIPKGSIVEFIEMVVDIPYNNLDTIWLKVEYRDVVGYSYAGFFDKYENEMAQNIVDLSDIETKTRWDAKQYIILDGKKKYNQCGQLSVAYITGMRLSDVLTKWKIKSPNLVSRIWYGGADRGTSAAVLIDLLDALGVSNSVTFNSHFKDKLLNRTIFTPQRALEALREHYIVMGVKIGRDGFIGTGRVAHWIVLDSIEVFGKQAICHVYNPFNNEMQIYDFDSLVKAGASIDGVVVPAEKVRHPWNEEVLDVQPHPKPIEPISSFGASLSIEEKVELLWKEYEFVLEIRDSS